MLHTQIQSEEVIERYVRNRLTPDDRRVFEEHFFGCDACFTRVQEMEKFVAGVRDAAECGNLAGPVAAAVPVTAGSLRWAFAACTCVGVVLAITVGWLTLTTLPKLRGDLNATTAQIKSQQQMITRLEAGPTLQEAPEANVPLVMLQSERGSQTAEAVLPTDAKRLVLWVEIEPTRYSSYRIDIFSPSGVPVATIDHLARGPYGALAAGVPADQLRPGVFRITLTGQAPPPASLVAEYRLQIRKP